MDLQDLSMEELYAAYADKVRTYLRSRISSPEDVEDLQASVFVRIIRQFRSERRQEITSLNAWVFSICRNLLTDYYRHRNSMVDDTPLSEDMTDTLASGENLEADYLAREELRSLAQAMKRLEDEERDVIVFYYYDGLTRQQIAERMGITYGQVRVLQRRALSRIRSCMEGEGNDESGR